MLLFHHIRGNYSSLLGIHVTFLMKVLVPSLFQSARETKILQVLAIVKNEDFIILFMYSYLAFDHSKFAKHFVIQNLLAGLHNLVNFV